MQQCTNVQKHGTKHHQLVSCALYTMCTAHNSCMYYTFVQIRINPYRNSYPLTPARHYSFKTDTGFTFQGGQPGSIFQKQVETDCSCCSPLAAFITFNTMVILTVHFNLRLTVTLVRWGIIFFKKINEPFWELHLNQHIHVRMETMARRWSRPLTHALKRSVAITPLSSQEALNIGIFMGLEVKPLIALVNCFGAHCVFLAKDNTVFWSFGNSTGDSWRKRKQCDVTMCVYI